MVVMRDDSQSPGRYILGIVLLLFAMWMGLKLPDIDQSWLKLPYFIWHRSILTHGLLIPLFLLVQFYACGKKTKNDPLPRLGLMGLLIGLSVHFAFDLFPRSWVWSFARIHVPMYGWTPTWFSQLWLAASLLFCLHMGCRLLRSVNELFLSLTVLVVAFVLCAQTESSYAMAPLLALLALAGAGAVAFLLRKPGRCPTVHRYVNSRKTPNP